MSLKSLASEKKRRSFTKKILDKIDHLQFGGFFNGKDAEEQNLRLVTGKEGKVCLYWLVRESDGMICDARFQVFGPLALIMAAEVACLLAVGKNYDQASRISADLLDRQLRDKKEEAALALEEGPFLNQILTCIDKAVYQCIDIPFAATDYDTTPISWDVGDNPEGLPGWEGFSQEMRVKIIEEVIDKEIRPYVELDAGGVKIVDLKEGKEVMISYEGSCTTCHSSTGSTLSAIQQILKARVHPSLFVTPVL